VAVGTPPDATAYARYFPNLSRLLESIGKINLHFLRKENQLFPMLEKHDVTGPSQVMWSLDDDIRGMIKKCVLTHEKRDLSALLPLLAETLQALRDMIYKEEHILFPMAMEALSEDEWAQVKKGEHEIGFAWILSAETLQSDDAVTTKQQVHGTDISLDTGTLTSEQINLMLTHLPVDVSFVNERDEVCYYSATKERIFPRSAGVIGRKVQNCHPPKSMPRVQEILNAFRDGVRDTAEFWLTMSDRFIHIRYFAMRSADGAYRGCLEVSQDVTDIRALEGEQRLLD
jgi:uncharacterized protein